MPDESESIASLDQLPDDPLSMPPPYWRSAVGIFHIQQSVSQIADNLLPKLVLAKESWDAVSDDVDLETDTEDDESPYPEELDVLMDIEAEIIRLIDLAIFMAAIEAEDAVNQFAVFNIHKDAAEAIESLSPPDKLILVTALAGAPPVKSTAVFESIRKLTSWRNAAAHGHCVDRPTSSLRKNHLIPPKEYPAVPTKLSELQARLGDYLRVKEYLHGISINNYTSDPVMNDREIAESLGAIKSYRFRNVSGHAYDIYPPTGQE
jgi:hypothetical protein